MKIKRYNCISKRNDFSGSFQRAKESFLLEQNQIASVAAIIKKQKVEIFAFYKDCDAPNLLIGACIYASSSDIEEIPCKTEKAYKEIKKTMDQQMIRHEIEKKDGDGFLGITIFPYKIKVHGNVPKDFLIEIASHLEASNKNIF